MACFQTRPSDGGGMTLWSAVGAESKVMDLRLRAMKRSVAYSNCFHHLLFVPRSSL